MTKSVIRALIWVVGSISAAILLISFAAYRIHAGMLASVEHKSAKSTTATVSSVTGIPEQKFSNNGGTNQLFRVCFTLDNFNEVEAHMREGYEAAENQRLAREGPRCETTSKATIAKHLSTGDKLEVIYLLENQYRIDIVSTTAFGESL
jgi:hypothetical protein